MAVKTIFTKNEIKKIISNYNLDNLVNFSPIIKGTVQTNFMIKTIKGKFVLRYYENRSKNSVLFEINLINYLKKNKFPCPALIPNKSNNFIGIFKNKPYVLFEFIEGKHIEKPNKKQKTQLICKIAELQNLTKDYIPLYKKYRWNYNIKLCKTLAKKEVKKINTKNAREKLKWFKIELKKIIIPKSLPKGICHCDFHFSNVLFKNGEFTALIDFDDANYTYLCWDIMALIEPFVPSFNWDSWNKFKINENLFDFSQAKKQVQEYNYHRSLSNEEKLYLFDVYKLGILFDCIWYFKRGDANNFYEKRKIEALNKLGRKGFYNALFSK